MNENNINKQSKRINTHIGARCLDRDTVLKMIPGIEDLGKIISDFRYNAKECHNEEVLNSYSQQNNQFYFEKYDNFVSILGSRGLGKTSTLMTIINEIEHHTYFNDDQVDAPIVQYDLISPLVVPDNMGETSDILGWIIVILKKMYEEQILYFVDSQYNLSRLIDSSFEEQKSKINKLFLILEKNYQFRKFDYQQIIAKYYDNSTNYIQKNIEIQKQDFEITNIFQNLIDSLVDMKIKVNKLFKINQTPLIFFFFDDVDTTAKYCTNILEQLLVFLSHPNIVVFISGDYELFSQSVTLKLLKDENLENRSINESYVYGDKESRYKAIQLATSRSGFFLKKVLPPLYRYEIRLLDNKQKNTLTYGKISDNENLNETILGFIDRICYGEDNHISNQDKFFIINNEPIYVYLSIFSSNARSCMNVYLFLYNQYMYKKKLESWSYITFINKMLEIIIDSKESYRTRVNDINKFLYIKEFNYDSQDDFKKVRIDCEELKFVIDSRLANQSKTEPLNEDIKMDIESLLMLVVFINELLFCFAKKSYEHRYKRIKQKLHLILVDILCASYNSGITQLIPYGSDLKDSLYIYSCLTARMSTQALFHVFNTNKNYPFTKKLLNENNDKKYFVQLMKAISDYGTAKFGSDNNIINRKIYDSLCYQTDKGDEMSLFEVEGKLLAELIKKFKETDYEWLLNLKECAIDSLSTIRNLYPYKSYVHKYVSPELRMCLRYARILKEDVDVKEFEKQILEIELLLEQLSFVFSNENVKACLFSHDKFNKEYFEILLYVLKDCLTKMVGVKEKFRNNHKKSKHQLNNVLGSLLEKFNANTNGYLSDLKHLETYERIELFENSINKFCVNYFPKINIMNLNFNNVDAIDNIKYDNSKKFIDKLYYFVKTFYLVEQKELISIINDKLFDLDEIANQIMEEIDRFLDTNDLENDQEIYECIRDAINHIYYNNYGVDEMIDSVMEYINNFLERDVKVYERCKTIIQQRFNLVYDMHMSTSNHLENLCVYISLIPLYVVSIYSYDLFVDTHKIHEKKFFMNILEVFENEGI